MTDLSQTAFASDLLFAVSMVTIFASLFLEIIHRWRLNLCNSVIASQTELIAALREQADAQAALSRAQGELIAIQEAKLAAYAVRDRAESAWPFEPKP